MKFTLVLFLLCLVGVFAVTSQASHLGCHTGNVEGFAAIRDDPPYLVGTIPSHFTSDSAYFSSRYSCTGQHIQVRRIDTGFYEIRFPRVAVHLALATAISDEGVSASVRPLTNGIVRVALRGPLTGSDVAARRDVPFSIAVF